MKNLNITVVDKVATYCQRDGSIVCGNSDYQIIFAFDSDWDGYETKIARFIWNGAYVEQEFTGSTCVVPVINNASEVRVGVYVKDDDAMETTTSAVIPCKRSVLCESNEAQAAHVAVWRDRAELAALRSEEEAESAEAAALRAETAAENAKVTVESIETDAQSVAISANTAEAAALRAETAAEQVESLSDALDNLIVQTTGDSETQVMSQKTVTRLFDELEISHEETLEDGTVNVIVGNNNTNEDTGDTEDTNKVTDITDTLTWASGYYIEAGGAMRSASDGRYSDIITLNKGQAIRVTAAGGGNGGTAIISQWSADGNTYISCACQASGDGKSLETVEHIATETEYLRISYHYYFTVTVNKAQVVVETYNVSLEEPEDTTQDILGDCSQINGRNLVDKGARNLANSAMAKAENAIEAIKAIPDITPTTFENLYSSENNVEGQWINSGGKPADASNATYTSISVESGKDVYLCYVRPVGVNVQPIDISKVETIRFANGETPAPVSYIKPANIQNYLISGNYMGEQVLKLTVPENANRIEFCVKLYPDFDATETMIVSYTDLTTVLTGWKPKVWADKKWACVGDSLTDSDTEYTTLRYHDYIADATGIEVVNMGKRGTAYAKNTGESNNRIYDRIVDVPTDADVVTIFGSFNDLAAGLPLGEIDDTELTTVCGYINATLDRLYAVMPTVQLGIITPTPWKGFNAYQSTADSNVIKYVDNLIGICEKRGIPYLDLFRCSNLRPWDATFRQYAYSKESNDGGTHPDETGNKIFAPRVLEFLKTLLIY